MSIYDIRPYFERQNRILNVNKIFCPSWNVIIGFWMWKYYIRPKLECQNTILSSILNVKKRKTKSEKWKMKSSKQKVKNEQRNQIAKSKKQITKRRKMKNEKQNVKNEKRKTNQPLPCSPKWVWPIRLDTDYALLKSDTCLNALLAKWKYFLVNVLKMHSNVLRHLFVWLYNKVVWSFI